MITNVFSPGRADLAEATRELDAQFVQAGAKRRHLPSTFVALRQPDDTVVPPELRVAAERPGELPTVHPASVDCGALGRLDHGSDRPEADSGHRL